MSLNRAVIALGAVAVVGAATLGVSIPLAAHYGKPVPSVAITTGSNWNQIAPTCYGKGKALSAKERAGCTAKFQAEFTAGKLPTVNVSPNGTFSINMDQIAADKGWGAESLAGTLVARSTDAYAGNISVANLMNLVASASQSQTAVTSTPIQIVETDGTNIYGEWHVLLKLKNS